MHIPSLVRRASATGALYLLLSSLDFTLGLTFSTVATKSSFLCGQQVLPINNSNNNDHHSSRKISFLTMKVSKGKSKQARSKGSQIALKNEARMKAAGRKGTKKFVDPNKVFVGNLSYNATESHLRKFLLETGGIPEANIEAIKIIRDWKTGQSKGYGFIQFMGPIYATSAMELIKGKRLLGRIVRLDQGKKKDEKDAIVVVKNKRQNAQDLEDQVVLNALKDAEDNTYQIEQNEYDQMDVEEQQEVLEEGSYLDEYDDDALFDDEDDEDEDDDFQYDGVYIEEYLPDKNDDNNDKNAPMNREKRREAAKKNKKRRKPGKGFS